jgi:hypothetical protein
VKIINPIIITTASGIAMYSGIRVCLLVYVAAQHYITVERRNDMMYAMTMLVGWGNFSCIYDNFKKGLINYGTARAELALRHNHYF